ncbi:glycosyltransferase [Dolichospermum planctonicum UHCC 0167]|jgi:glycosyltransferase involved in cell wall biosynthesis|uniref:glycosyltransferase family 2 protein n=1 Tax=Dolichospermum planctonicum TaxID=136072 RepID=UPI001443159E|nr:glycosyltransferase [Dolichospermum planctonicum]MCW9682198.1 glycosyltransferase [Dolichospermum planctonicum UHCC 0167]
MSLCEVRVTTYKRPDLLKRALSSLTVQTYDNWKCLVLDDSPAQEARLVVESFNDNRIIYQPHPNNLGRAKNLDYAFLSTDYIGGLYAFVLEDDNYLFPTFIAENIQSLETHNVNIVLRNAEIRLQTDQASIPTGETNREKWYIQGIYTPFEIYARLFFCEGITNSGLFWRTDKIRSNLQVGSQVKDALHQELFRTLQIKEPIYFEPNPLCVFTLFDTHDHLKNQSALHKKIDLIRYRRGVQSILIYLVNKYGEEIVNKAQEIALMTKSESVLENRLLEVFYLNYEFKTNNKFKALSSLSRHLLRALTLPDPYQDIYDKYL